MTFSLVLFVTGCAVWAECVVWYGREQRRRGNRTPWSLPLIIALGFASFFALGIRLLRWTLVNVIEWVGRPVLLHAQARRDHRKRRKQAERQAQAYPTVGNVLTAGAVRQLPALPPPPVMTVQQVQPQHQALALPAGQQQHEDDPDLALLYEGDLISSPDGTLTHRIRRGNQTVLTGVLRGPDTPPLD
jgi:hypothetical protein